MKKILLLTVICLSFFVSYAQPVVSRAGAANTVSDGRLQALYNFFLPRYLDTTSANTQKGVDSCGAIIFTYLDNKIWKRNCNPKQWASIGTGDAVGGIQGVYADYGLINVNDSTLRVDTTLAGLTTWALTKKKIDSLGALIGSGSPTAGNGITDNSGTWNLGSVLSDIVMFGGNNQEFFLGMSFSKLDQLHLYANSVNIPDLGTIVDSTTYKPVVINSAGKLFKGYWFGDGGGGGSGSGIGEVVGGYGLINTNDSTLRVDTSLLTTRLWHQKTADSITALLGNYLLLSAIGDTLANYIDTTIVRNGLVSYIGDDTDTLEQGGTFIRNTTISGQGLYGYYLDSLTYLTIDADDSISFNAPLIALRSLSYIYDTTNNKVLVINPLTGKLSYSSYVGGGGGGGATTLEDLTDVNITAVADGDVLTHNGTEWVNQAGVEIDITGIATNDVPIWDGTKFIKFTPNWALASRTLTDGYGLSGGGDLSANRTFVVDTINIGKKDWVKWYVDSLNLGAGGLSTATFPLKVSGSDVSLFPKVTQTPSQFSTTPNNLNLQWTRTSAAVRPHWYDGVLGAYYKDTLLNIAGWYDNGVPFTTDSVYYSVDNGVTWALHPVRFPYASHAFAYTYNKARGYWVFAGGDGYNTSTINKTVTTTTDFRTYTTRTSDYGGSVRTLGSIWADDNGSLYWGFGQADPVDSSTALHDIWKSTDDGATWTQIATDVNVGGYRLGGITVNTVKYRNGYVYGITMGGRQDLTAGERTFSKRNFKADINDLQNWWEIDTLPLSTGRHYPGVEVYNSWVWMVTGNNASGNQSTVLYLDNDDKWHGYNSFVGSNPTDATFTVSHAAAITVYKDMLVRMLGNGNNDAFTLSRKTAEFLERSKTIVGNYLFGNVGKDAWVGINLPDTSYITASTFFDARASQLSLTDYARIESNNPYAFRVLSSTVTNNATGISLNGTYGVLAGHSTGTYANAFIIAEQSDNTLPLIVKNNGHVILGDNGTTIPTNVSFLQVKGIVHSNLPSLTMMAIDSLTGDVYHLPVPTGGGGGGTYTAGYGLLESSNVFSVDTSWNMIATKAYVDSAVMNTSGITINNNTNNYLVTASGTANTLNGESTLTYNAGELKVTNGYAWLTRTSTPGFFLTNSTSSWGLAMSDAGSLVAATYNSTLGSETIRFTVQGDGTVLATGNIGLPNNKSIYFDNSNDYISANSVADQISVFTAGSERVKFGASTTILNPVLLTGLSDVTPNTLLGHKSSDGMVTTVATGVGMSITETINAKSYALTSNTTDVGNVTTGEDDLMTYTLPAGQLATNGDYIEVSMTFTIAANGNSKTLKMYLGSTNIFQTSPTSGDIMTLVARIYRTGATTQKMEIMVYSLNVGSIPGPVTTISETLSGTLVIKATGEAVATDDIVQKTMTVKYFSN